MFPLMRSNPTYAQVDFVQQMELAPPTIRKKIELFFGDDLGSFLETLNAIDKSAVEIVDSRPFRSNEIRDIRGKIRDSTRHHLDRLHERFPKLRYGSVEILCDGSNQFNGTQINLALIIHLTSMDVFSIAKGFYCANTRTFRV